jgi:hypothetical protein
MSFLNNQDLDMYIIISALTFVCQNNGGIIINIFDFLLNEASLNI